MTTKVLQRKKSALSIGFDGQLGPLLNSTNEPYQLDFSDLDAAVLAQIAPDQIISWLFCSAYDAYDISQILTDVGFRGTYTALVSPLPRQSIITKEIRRSFPTIRFELLLLTDLPNPVADYHSYVANAQPNPNDCPSLVFA